MPQRIEVPLLKRLVKSPPPGREVEIADSEITGFLLKHLPSGSVRFYAQVARGRRETIAHERGSGQRAVKRGDITIWPVDARDVLDRTKPEISLKWVRKECRRLQGEIIGGEDYTAKRKAQRGIPTLRDFLDDAEEGVYGWWLVHNRKDGANSLARIEHCFIDRFGDLKLDQITPSLLDAWRTRRLKGIGIRKASRETCNRDTGALKAALSKAVEWEILITHPLVNFRPAKVDRHRRAIRRLYEPEIKALKLALEAREDRMREERLSGNTWREERGYTPLPSLDGVYVDALRPAIEISLETGMRKAECFGLTWEMVDLKRHVIRLPGEATKSFTSREIPLNKRALKTLRKWKMQQGRSSKGYVFPGTAGHLGSLKKSFSTVLDAAGIERMTGEGKVTWHSFRHTFGSRLGEVGVDAEAIREIMGHSDLKTTQRYLKSSKEHKRAAVEALV